MTKSSSNSSDASNKGSLKAKKESQTLAFNGTLPSAQCNITKTFMDNSGHQIGSTKDIAIYIKDNCTESGTEKHDFHTFNNEQKLALVPFLVCIENTRMLRVVYACGTTKDLHGLHKSKIEKLLLCLSGDVNMEMNQQPEVLK